MANKNIAIEGKPYQFTSTFQPVRRGRKRQLLKVLAQEDDISMTDQLRWWNHCRQITSDDLKATTNDTNLPGWMIEIARLQYRSQCGDLKAFNSLQDRFYGKPIQRVESEEKVTVSGRPVLNVAHYEEEAD